MHVLTQCRRVLIVSAVNRCAARSLCGTASVVSMHRWPHARPSSSAPTADCRTSHLRTSASAARATVTSSGTLCVPRATPKRRRSWITSCHTVGCLLSSGRSRTGKDSAFTVTPSRPHARSGIGGHLRDRWGASLKNSAGGSIRILAQWPLLTPASHAHSGWKPALRIGCRRAVQDRKRCCRHRLQNNFASLLAWGEGRVKNIF
jgi:hypothetical protein